MLAIINREFWNLFKSFKTILVILFFSGVSYLVPSIIDKLFLIQDEVGIEDGYTAGISFIVTFLGFLFVLLLSHDIINKEIESQTIRLLVTKIARKDIIIGKFIGVLLFWVVCTGIAFIVISISAKQIFVFKFIQLVIFFTYPIALCILLSVIIKKPSFSVFCGLLLGLIFPVLGIWCGLSSHWLWKILNFLMPFHYVDKNNILSLIPFVLSIMINWTSIFVFNRRDI